MLDSRPATNMLDIRQVRYDTFNTILWHIAELARLGRTEREVQGILNFARPNLSNTWTISWEIVRLNQVLEEFVLANPELRGQLSEWYIEPGVEDDTQSQEDSEGIYAPAIG